jgi:hypothetical protein
VDADRRACDRSDRYRPAHGNLLKTESCGNLTPITVSYLVLLQRVCEIGGAAVARANESGVPADTAHGPVGR